MATTTTHLMTVEEYAKVPNPPGGVYELYHGELIALSYPKHPHVRAQRQLRRLLEAAAGNTGVVHTELPYRPLPEHECWCADVAYLPTARWQAIKDWLLGAPDLVVEVLSTSNTAATLLDKRKICLENGAREFWVVNTDLRQVDVYTPDGRGVTYKSDQRIPLLFGGGIPAHEIFA